jgi:hypothetical protein
MPVTSYSRTPASNNSAPPNGAPEGQTPGSVNNVIRQIMTDIVNEAGKGAARVLGSVAGTNTITAAMSPALDAYAAGMIVVLTPANTNTGAATLNIDSLGALDVFSPNGAALVAGEFVAGVPSLLVLDAGADDWVLVGPANTGQGSFTGTVTGMSGATTGTVKYKIANGVVTLYVDSSITGTSNSSSMQLTGLPAAIQSAVARRGVSAFCIDNSAAVMVSHEALTTAVTFSPFLAGAFSTWTASGTKGIQAGWSITYPL